QIEGALAPGMQYLECLAQCRLLRRSHGGRAVDRNGIGVEVTVADRVIRQGVQRSLPARQVTTALYIQTAVDLFGERVAPAGQPRLRCQPVHEGLRVDHRIATSDAKLKHWNQTSTL